MTPHFEGHVNNKNSFRLFCNALIKNGGLKRVWDLNTKMVAIAFA